MVFVAVPPPIRGLGASGGFQMMVEDRASLGLAELQKAVMEVISAGELPVRFAQPGHHLQRPQPPALPGYRPDQGRSRCRSP